MPKKSSCFLQLQGLGNFGLKCFARREDYQRFWGLMVFASRPRLTNFEADPFSVFRADTFQHFLVGCELAWPKSSHLGCNATANAQQDTKLSFQVVQSHDL